MNFQEAKETSLRIAEEMTRLFRERGYEVTVEGECNISGAIGCFINTTEAVQSELFMSVLREAASNLKVPLPDKVFKQPT